MVLGSGGLHDESERAMNKQRSSTHEARVSWLEYEQVIGERLVDIKCRKNEKSQLALHLLCSVLSLPCCFFFFSSSLERRLDGQA